MFSQWATKRVCKFFMKRLLGRMLRSELDLEQLEVQLGFGTIQLKDIFLNTDYLNDQLGDAVVAIKEGSVGSVRAKIPWRVLTTESCEIEVDELKLVIVPRPRPPGEDNGSGVPASSGNDNLRFVEGPQFQLGDTDASGLGAAEGVACMGVDDGVRMIAKMVERVLLGLRVKVSNIILVFEEQTEKISNSLPEDVDIPRPALQSTSPQCLLILRVANVEYGVEAPQNDVEEPVMAASETETGMLVKVVKFKGATVEMVDVEDDIVECERPADDPGAVDTPRVHFLGQPVFVLVGETGGLSGSIHLSVPWRDGIVDVPKVHADFSVSPIKMILSPHQIQQIVKFTKAYSRDGGLTAGSSQSGPGLKSSMWNGGNLGNFSGSRVHSAIAADRNSELLKSFSGSMGSKNGRGIEAESSSTSFLPVTRFISDWMHWAGSEGQRKDGTVAEADLAASVDEFFDCFDGTRSSQASFSSSGMWSWTRSAFSAITAASSLAAGSIVLAPDPPKQPEYTMKARLSGIFLDLCYGTMSVQKPALASTLAGELRPFKKVSTKLVEDSVGKTSSDGANFKRQDEECLKVELCELNVSVLVSGSQTEFSATVKDLDVSEVVLKEPVDEIQTFGSPRWQPHVENSVSITRILQASIEHVLPSFPCRLSGNKSRAESDRNTPEEGLIGSHQAGRTAARTDMYEKKQLLRVLTELDDAARVTVTWQCAPFGSGATSTQTELIASLQPVAIWLDVPALKRIELLMQKTKDTMTERKESVECTVSDHNPSSLEEAHSPETKLGLLVDDNDVQALKDRVIERGPLRVKLFAPCVRVIICFPVGFAAGSSVLQEDFVALDIFAPSAQLGITPPLVDYNHLGETTTISSSSAADTLTLRIGDVSASLVSSMDETHSENDGGRGFALTADEILVIHQQDSIWGSLPTLDRKLENGVSVEFQWQGGSEVSSWVAKRAWDGVAAQKRQGDGGRGIGGSNSEFAAATTAAESVEVENLQIRKELLGCSNSSIRVNIPHIKLRLSEPQYTRVLQLIGCFLDALAFKDEESGAEGNTHSPRSMQPQTDTSGPPGQTLQTALLVQSGRVDVALCLNGQHTLPALKQSARPWDVIRLKLEKLQVLSVLGVGGNSNASYLWVQHEESEITGSFLDESPTGQFEEPAMLLLSCNREALGRGDGGMGNALAAGKAGLTITHMVWPGQQPLGDALLTGTIRGITFVAHSGRLDWVSAVTQFFNASDQMEGSGEMSLKSGLELDQNETESKLDKSASSPSMRTYFLLDFHDVALCYEPGSETMHSGGMRAGRDSWRRGMPSPADSSQILAPVACVVAAAAVRVSSSGVPRVMGEQYDFWLRDVALHLLDSTLRKKTSFDYTTECMHQTGYVQIAREAVMEALVRIDGENGLQWELECANNQLRFDTCHDTTAAFGRLVAQLQQLFVPEIEPQTANVKSWKADGSGGESPSFTNRTVGGAVGDTQNGADSEEFNNLFEGVLEDAFSRARSSCSSAAGDDVVDDQGEMFTVVGAPLYGRVISLDSNNILDRNRQDLSEQAVKSVPSTPTQPPHLISRTPSEESVIINNTGLPTFIEDYYVTTQNHSLHAVGVLLSRQGGDSPRISAGSSRQSSRESTSPGSGREVEGKGGWYSGKGLEVMEDHVPDEAPRVDEGGQGSSRRSRHPHEGHSRKVSLPTKYPSSVGRVVLRDLSARWRLYGGSDWPRAGQDQRSPPHSNSEESERRTETCMEVLLDGMDLQYDAFPAVGLYASRLVVSIRDIGVCDRSTDAPWRMVLGYHRSKSRPRESASQAVKIEMDSVRPDPQAPLEEYRLSIGLLPIRLHLDQRHIDFCIEFFSPHQSSSAGGQSPDEGSYPVAGTPIPGSSDLPSDTNGLVEDALLPFFQICEMRPFTICVDYLPRRVDLISLRGGNYAELLNLVTWKGIELNLKHVRAAGVHGWSSLSGVIFGEWLEDISQNQVHKFVQGVGPIRPLYAVGSGAAKLLVLPAEHYRKDRRPFRGMRKGAIAFLRSISLEALGLGAHLAAGAHEILQQTELALGGTPIPTPFTSEKGNRRSKAIQPGDAREGIQQACESLSQGLERTASSLVGNPLKVYQRGAGAGVAVVSALRAAPAAAVAPASAAAGAFHRALLGVRNELDPERKRESDEKHAVPPRDTRRAR